ncbi:unnamed protein product [Nippostrongylus brasiliensis]|uniref:Uncharacterized protein n=1 Tax=Nippostrongylus brasiliensis TaxID=27835 RepID=A0A0N4Y0Z5_NIPBR|nr:unnamed protein product [Nippostrongylus brasiliensis]
MMGKEVSERQGKTPPSINVMMDDWLRRPFEMYREGGVQDRTGVATPTTLSYFCAEMCSARADAFMTERSKADQASIGFRCSERKRLAPAESMLNSTVTVDVCPSRCVMRRRLNDRNTRAQISINGLLLK